MTPIDWLAQYEGKHEDTHRDLDRFFRIVGRPGHKTNSTAWCAAAAYAALVETGYREIVEAIPIKHRLMARAFDVYEAKLKPLGLVRLGDKKAITSGKARRGDIVTYRRGNATSNRKRMASGHIDFFTRYEGGMVWGLGGNESDKVQNGGSAIARVLSVYRLPEPRKEPKKGDKFPPLLTRLLKHEGGFSDHPSDPGGATKYGITLATYRRLVKRGATVSDLKRLTKKQAGEIYREHYWRKLRINELPSGVDYATLDFRVNSGGRGIKFLQRVVGVEQDGEIGPVTLAAVRKGDAKVISARLCDDRLAFLKGLKTWPTFGRGWSRRVRDVRTYSLKLASTKRDPEPDDTGTKTKPKGIWKMMKIFSNLLGIGGLGTAFGSCDKLSADPTADPSGTMMIVLLLVVLMMGNSDMLEKLLGNLTKKKEEDAG